MSINCRLILLCDVGVTPEYVSPSDAWDLGPFVENYTDHMGENVKTDAVTRATNFPVSLADRLFGGIDEQTSHIRFSTPILNSSWNSDEQTQMPGCTTLVRAELLVSAPDVVDSAGNGPGVLALHFTVAAPTFGEAVQVANLLARQRGKSGTSLVHGALTYLRIRALHPLLCEGLIFPTDNGAAAETESTIYSMILIDQMTDEGGDPSEFSVRQAYSAASCQPFDRLHASEDALGKAAKAAQRLSKSWSALFLRHGASFMIHAGADDSFRNFMPVYFGTLYADAVMLARLQGQIVRKAEVSTEYLLEKAASNPHLGSVSRDFENLDRQLAVNSARYWMRRSESNSGTAIKIVHAAQDAMFFSSRLSALDTQIDGLARISAADAHMHSLNSQNKLATVVTLLGSIAIPVTFLTDFYQLLGLPVTPLNVGGLVLVMIIFGGMTWWALRRLLTRV